MSTASASGKPGLTAASAARIVVRSIISMAAGMMPAAMTSETAFPRRVCRIERGQQRAHRLGTAQQPEGHLRDHGQRPLRPHQHPEEIEPGAVERRSPEVDHLAVGQHRLDAQHVVHGEAVLEAVGAPGVLGYIAADRADDLARRVGRIVVAVGGHPAGDLQVHDARLHRDPLVRNVNVEHPVHARHDDEHPVGMRQGAGREPRALSPRHERDAVAVAEPHHRPAPARPSPAAPPPRVASDARPARPTRRSTARPRRGRGRQVRRSARVRRGTARSRAWARPPPRPPAGHGLAY